MGFVDSESLSLPSSGVEVAVSVVVSLLLPGCVFVGCVFCLVALFGRPLLCPALAVCCVVACPFFSWCTANSALLLSGVHVHGVALLTRPLFCAFRTFSASASPASAAVSTMLLVLGEHSICRCPVGTISTAVFLLSLRSGCV